MDRKRSAAAVLALGCALLWLPRLGAQTTAARMSKTDARADLEGTWVNSWATPLERPEALKYRSRLTDEEVQRFRLRAAAIFSTSQSDAPVADGAVFAAVLGTSDVYKNPNATGAAGLLMVPLIDNRTSLIIDPSNGRLPPYTAAGAARNSARLAAVQNYTPSDPEVMTMGYRCVSSGTPRLAAGEFSYVQIVQTADYVVLGTEWMHDARIVPLNSRAHLPSHIRRLSGDARGRWEGTTLVIDTTNFAAVNNVLGSDDNLHLVERISRTAPDTLTYVVTVDDPTVWTAPWTASIRLTQTDKQIFEVACHEGNATLKHILEGARTIERRN